MAHHGCVKAAQPAAGRKEFRAGLKWLSGDGGQQAQQNFTAWVLGILVDGDRPSSMDTGDHPHFPVGTDNGLEQAIFRCTTGMEQCFLIPITSE